MTPDEFQTHIAWPGDKSFYQGEAAAGHGNINENEAEVAEEEGTSGSFKIAYDEDTTSDDDEEMGGE